MTDFLCTTPGCNKLAVRGVGPAAVATIRWCEEHDPDGTARLLAASIDLARLKKERVALCKALDRARMRFSFIASLTSGLADARIEADDAEDFCREALTEAGWDWAKE